MSQLRALQELATQGELSFADVTAVVGQPKDDIGSGIHIFLYPIAEGTLRVGTPDRTRVMYVVLRRPSGTEETVFRPKR